MEVTAGQLAILFAIIAQTIGFAYAFGGFRGGLLQRVDDIDAKLEEHKTLPASRAHP